MDVDPASLLAAYDQQLRGEAETTGATTTSRLGPLHLATFGAGHGFVTYRSLDGLSAGAVVELVTAALDRLAADPAVRHVEWKTRGHDQVSGLHEALLGHGFVAQETESIMVGDARGLAVDVALPAGVSLRSVEAAPDVRAASAMQDEVFGSPVSTDRADRLLERLARHDGTQLWVAEADGRVVSAGRVEPVAETEFAGLWGGATRPEWRGRGIYRALTAARARSALGAGHRFVHSDSTEFSRPILERSGLVMVSTTTPYEWRRQG